MATLGEAGLGERGVERVVVLALRRDLDRARRTGVLREQRVDRLDDGALVVAELEVHATAHSRGKPSTRLAIRLRFTSVVPTATPAVIARRNCASAKEPYSSASGAEELEREIGHGALGERARDARDVGVRARRQARARAGRSRGS